MLSVDPASGRPRASDELHADIHFLARQDACTRFRAFMPYGAAGLLAIGLAPADMTASDADLHFVTTSVEVADDSVTLAGTMAAG